MSPYMRHQRIHYNHKHNHKMEHTHTSSCPCSCSCRHSARFVVGILEKHFPDHDIPRVKLSLDVMHQYGAVPSKLSDLYITLSRKYDYYFIGNYPNLLELLYTTRHSQRVQVITTYMKKYANRIGVEYGSVVNKFGNPEQIIEFIQDNGYNITYKPGVLYSLYSWAKNCSCCKRHRRDFPTYCKLVEN